LTKGVNRVSTRATDTARTRAGWNHPFSASLQAFPGPARTSPNYLPAIIIRVSQVRVLLPASLKSGVTADSHLSTLAGASDWQRNWQLAAQATAAGTRAAESWGFSALGNSFSPIRPHKALFDAVRRRTAWTDCLPNGTSLMFGKPGTDFYEPQTSATPSGWKNRLSPADVALQCGHSDGGALIVSTYRPSLREKQARDRIEEAWQSQPTAASRLRLVD